MKKKYKVVFLGGSTATVETEDTPEGIRDKISRGRIVLGGDGNIINWKHVILVEEVKKC